MSLQPFNRLVSQRKGLGLSVAKVAKYVGVSRESIYNWEKGKSIPDVKYLNKLSEILQIEIGILVTYFANRS